MSSDFLSSFESIWICWFYTKMLFIAWVFNISVTFFFSVHSIISRFIFVNQIQGKKQKIVATGLKDQISYIHTGTKKKRIFWSVIRGLSGSKSFTRIVVALQTELYLFIALKITTFKCLLRLFFSKVLFFSLHLQIQRVRGSEILVVFKFQTGLQFPMQNFRIVQSQPLICREKLKIAAKFFVLHFSLVITNCICTCNLNKHVKLSDWFNVIPMLEGWAVESFKMQGKTSKLNELCNLPFSTLLSCS